MPRVVRILVYETESEEDMKLWLSRSLPDGQPRHVPRASVTAYTLNSDARRRIMLAMVELEDAYNQLVQTAPRVAPGPPTGDGKENQ
jgi:hypothetical protein